MWDNVDLGESPSDETCAQLGQPGYREQALLELRELKRIMMEIWPPPEGHRCDYRITNNPHDFGTYYSLQAIFDPDDQEAADWAYAAEDKVPKHWDTSALQKLAERGFAELGKQYSWLEEKA